jgi:5-methylcytosine-specific restriction endonuclease McrA
MARVIGDCGDCGQRREGRRRVALGGEFRCNKCQARAKYLADRDRILAAQKARDAARREELREYQRQYREAHAEEIREQRARFRRENAERLRARDRDRRPPKGRPPTLAQILTPDELAERKLAYHRAYKRQWRQRFPERIREYRRRARDRDPERFAEYSRRWVERHPERARARGDVQNNRRRARKAGNDTRVVTAADMAHIRRQPCCACGAPGPSTVDHLIPVARGGRHAIGNLIPLCRRCNPSKGAWTWMEWRVAGVPRSPAGQPRPWDPVPA